MFAHGFTVTVERTGGRDRLGNKKPGTTHDVSDVAAAPGGSTEYVNGQATVVVQDTLYAPYSADVGSQDAITIPTGQALPAGTYQVDGEPQRYRNPFTRRPFGCVIRLTRAETGDETGG